MSVRGYASGGSTGATATLTVPAGTVAGDTLLACITGSWVATTASGGSTASGWTTVVADGGTNLGGGLWIATATAGSAGSTVTLAMSNSGFVAASLLVLTTTTPSVTRFQRIQNSAYASPQAMSLTGATTASSALVVLGGCTGSGTFTVSAGAMAGQASNAGGGGGSTFAAEAEPGAGSNFAVNVSRNNSANLGQWYVLAQIDPAGFTASGALNPQLNLAAASPGPGAALLLKGRSTKYNDSQAGG